MLDVELGLVVEISRLQEEYHNAKNTEERTEILEQINNLFSLYYECEENKFEEEEQCQE